MRERDFRLVSGIAGRAGRDAQLRDAFEMLFRANPQPMWIYERVTLRFLDVNDAAQERYGYTQDEFLSMTLADIRPGEDLDRLKRVTSGAARKGHHQSSGWRHVTRQGEQLHVRIYSHDIVFDDREAVLAMAVDVTELLEAIDALETEREQFQQLFDNSPEGIVMLDGEGRIVQMNEAFQQMFGYSREEALGEKPMSLIVPDDAMDDSLSAFRSNVDENRPMRLTSIRKRKNGELINVEVLAYPRVVEGRNAGVFAIYQDTTEKQRALRQIEYQARHDPLTGLANRTWLNERIARLLESEGDANIHAFLYVDLDQFKIINDTFGHTVGDRAIVEIGDLMRSHVRDGDLVARLGGDEFGILLPKCSEANATRKANEILQALNNYTFVWQGHSHGLGASIGIVEINANVASVENVLSAADAACYAAKDAGRNRIRVYQPDDDEIAARRTEVSWVGRLRHALDEDRFVLFHQHIHSIGGESVVPAYMEILLRYRDDAGRLVSPAAFVPSAERYGLMPAIDRWVVRRVCERLAATASAERVSINLSGTTVSDETFPEFVKDLFATTGVDATRVCFEITETAAISKLSAARRLIAELRALGSSIALDDFGSGMSSFRYLRTLDVDYLKIDGAFIREIDRNAVDHAMTEAIHNVGRILGLKTVAEFVENRETVEHLREIGVDFAQGYGLHVPEPWLD